MESEANTKSLMKDQAVRLFTYLREFVKLRSTVVRDINSYEEVLWLHEIQKTNTCFSAHWDSNIDRTDDLWVEIKKPKLPKIPTPPEICEKWYSRADLSNTIELPELKKEVYLNYTDPVTNITQTIEEHLLDHPEVKEAWDNYLEKFWYPWMEEYNEVKPLQDIYSKLYRMYNKSNKLGESYETILGLGFLVWKTPTNQTVRRHIISVQAVIEFDANTGSLCVKQGADGANMLFEDDMLEPSERPPFDIVQNLEEELKEHSQDPWDYPVISSLIGGWTNSLSSESLFIETDIPSRDISKRPVCYYSPAVFIRKRTQRGWITGFNTVIDRLKTISELPSNTSVLVDVYSDNKALSEPKYINPFLPDSIKNQQELLDDNIFFHLPTNEQQTEILQKLAKSNGVRVQGPPGTGKSHTIANIICHYLALGKKILVTAHAPRALKVLQEKIPEQLLSLCVSLMGHDRVSIENLKKSVNEITEKFNAWNDSTNTHDIHNLWSKLLKVKEELTVISRRLLELRESDAYCSYNPSFGYAGNLKQIAEKIKENEAEYCWIPDSVSEEMTNPLSNSEFNKLIILFREIKSIEEEDLGKDTPQTREILNPECFSKLVSDEKNLQDLLETYRHYEDDPEFQRILKINIEDRRNAIKSFENLNIAVSEGMRRANRPSYNWLSDAVSDMLADQDQPLRSLCEQTISKLDGMKLKAQVVDEYEIKLSEVDHPTMLADSIDLLEYFKANKRIGFWPFQNSLIRKTKYLWKETFVDGRACSNIATLEKLIEYLQLDKKIKSLKRDWADKVEKITGTFVKQEAVFGELLEALESVLAIDEPLQDCKRSVLSVLHIAEPRWNEKNDIEMTTKQLRASLFYEQRDNINKELDNHYEYFNHYMNVKKPHEISSLLKLALDERCVASWSAHYNNLEEMESRRQTLAERAQLFDRLSGVLPKLAMDLEFSFSDEKWLLRSEIIEEAFNWSKAETWLSTYELQHNSEELNARHKILQKQVLDTTKDLAVRMAWGHCFKNMTREQETSLLAWQNAIERFGTGKRKGSAQAKKDAAHHMQRCRSAIPAWIMPLYRVLDTVSFEEPEIFDLVIIDEASQCGPEALLLHYLGKKIIVVGDNEQVAPENVGVEVEDVERLRQQYLEGVPLEDNLGRDSTLFDNAGLRLREKVFLTEHYRCVPEIIQFCNDLCYAPQSKPLLALRQSKPDGLKPALKSIYIEGGCRDVSAKSTSRLKTNKPEAKRIVEEIIRCSENAEYKDKTFGMISMLGYEQARLIEGMLMESMSPEEYEKRKLLCGTSASFQGDERDVIFMSMVDDSDSRLSALTKDTDKRRYNVGVSRAKDQLFLFHSFRLNETRSHCLRNRLLAHCLHPQRTFLDSVDSVFESKFEEDVYNDIINRKYRVIPQVSFGDKRIDLVIEGMGDRLAVECDGDAWHGPDAWESDMARQRRLERCDWVFWRIRASEYYRDPNSAMNSLWDKLDDMRIYPLSVNKDDTNDEEIQETESFENNIKEYSSDYSQDEQNDQEVVFDVLERLPLAVLSKVAPQKTSTESIKAIIIQLLQESSKGADLLPTAVIRRAGISVRGESRRKLETRINRVIKSMYVEGIIEQYRTQKRKRYRLAEELICGN